MKCGFYETDITPPLGSNIFGYFSPRVVERVLDRMHARALVVDCGDSPAAIVALDMIYIPEGEFRSRVIERVLSFVPSWKKENFIITATHSHTSGPYRSLNEEDEIYIRNLTLQVADCIVLAWQKMEDMQISYSVGRADKVGFIRNFKMKDGKVWTNPPFKSPDIIEPCGEMDNSVPIMYFVGETGAMKGAVVNFACHHDCVHLDVASSDYSGVLAKELKKVYGDDFVCVFLNGFCGNINNFDIFGYDDVPPDTDYLRMGKILSDTVVHSRASAEVGSDVTADIAELRFPMRKRKLDEGYLDKMISYANQREAGKLKSNVIDGADDESFNKVVATEFVHVYRDKPDEIEAIVHALRIGDLIIYTAPGEIFSQFGDEIKKQSQAKYVMLAELSDVGMGFYVPPKELLEYTTMYETHPISRVFEEDTGDKIVEAALSAGKKLMMSK